MAHVHFGDVRASEKRRSRTLGFARRGDDRVGDAPFEIISSYDEFTFQKVGRELARAIRLAFIRVDEDRPDFGVRIGVAQRLIGKQN